MLAWGLDVGGTKIASALVAPTGAVLHRSWRLRGSDDELLHVLNDCYNEARGVAESRGETISGVGIGLAAWLSPDRSSVILGANLGLAEADLGRELQQRWQLPVTVENDGNAAALGEFRFGGHNVTSLIVITLGTGVGGGIINDGRLLIGGRGLAGELGHIPIGTGQAECACGGRGCLELVASGPAIARAANMGSPADVVAAAEAGHNGALQALSDAGAALGVGIAAIRAVLDPDLVVLTGSIAASAGDRLLPAIRNGQTLAHPLGRVRPPAPVELSRLGPYLGAYGAAALVLPNNLDPILLKEY